MTATEAATPPVTWELIDDIGVITLDDGRVNALSYQFLTQARECLVQAQVQSKAIVITGRPGKLSAGLDLKEVTAGIERQTAMIAAAGEYFGEIFTCPKPVVVACTGHAIAGGAIFLIVSDYRVGAEGEFQIGFSEVNIGVPLPEFAVVAAERWLLPSAYEPAVLGDMYSPADALRIGFLDKLVAPDKVLETAIARAKELGARDGAAYATTKKFARQPTLDRFNLA